MVALSCKKTVRFYFLGLSETLGGKNDPSSTIELRPKGVHNLKTLRWFMVSYLTIPWGQFNCQNRFDFYSPNQLQKWLWNNQPNCRQQINRTAMGRASTASKRRRSRARPEPPSLTTNSVHWRAASRGRSTWACRTGWSSPRASTSPTHKSKPGTKTDGEFFSQIALRLNKGKMKRKKSATPEKIYLPYPFTISDVSAFLFSLWKAFSIWQFMGVGPLQDWKQNHIRLSKLNVAAKFNVIWRKCVTLAAMKSRVLLAMFPHSALTRFQQLVKGKHICTNLRNFVHFKSKRLSVKGEAMQFI